MASIGEAQTIASLPRPFDHDRGKTRGNAVYSFDSSHQKKRKRSEVVVGVDGESINVYGIQNPRLIASYPSPPSSFLTSPPSSMVFKRRRYTYATLKAGSDSQPSRLVGFQEDVTGSHAPTKYECATHQELTFISMLSSEAGPLILSAAVSGNIEVRSPDLSSLASLSLDGQAGIRVQHVALLTASAARKGLLKDRGDLIPPDSIPTEVIVVVTQHHVHLINYSNESLRLLHSWTLPKIAGDCSQFQLEPVSGLLYHLSEQTLTVIELSLKAKIRKQIKVPQNGDLNFVLLSKSLAVVADDISCCLYDTKYGSLQATQSLSVAALGSNGQKKRKRETLADQMRARMLSWHPKSSTMVAYAGKSLVAFQISTPKSQKHITGTRLIDAFGKGSGERKDTRRHVMALAQQDPTLELLANLVINTQLQLEGLVESLQYLLNSFDPSFSGNSTNLITLGATSNDGISNKQDGEHSEEVTETDLADYDLSRAFSQLDTSHAELRGQALRAVLTRLGVCFAAPVVKSAIRLQLTPRDIVLLINLLRAELARSGWTSRRLDFYPADDRGEDPSGEAIHVIAKLLNCCVDALGVGGWLASSLSSHESDRKDVEDGPHAGQLSQDTSAETLIGLRQTTTTTLEAAQESAFFSNFLTDFLRYSNTVSAAQTKDQYRVSGSVAINGQAGPESNMLPLGSRDAEPISTIRVDAGGEIRERSRRDIAMKESRRIGRYTFERLRI